MNTDKRKKVVYLLLIITLLGWCALFLAKKINLINVDIGRHIKNGEFIVHGDDKLQYKVLHTNLYSYTNTNYPFVNHHWGSGILFYIVWKFVGFNGLSILYIFAVLIGFLVVFFIAWKESNFWIAYATAIVAAPLVGLRSEIRPEIATYFLGPILFWILWNYRKGRINYRWLFVLPLFFVIWVNMNLYFIFGLYLIGLFCVEAFWAYFRAKRNGDKTVGFYYDKMMFLFVVEVVSFLATVLNPWGIKGALYPFLINSQIEFSIFELASPFVLKMTGENPIGFESYFLLLGILFCCFVLLIFKSFRKKFSFIIFAWALTLAFFSVWQVRNVALFGMFMVPILAMTMNAVWKTFLDLAKKQNEYVIITLMSKKFKKTIILVAIPYLFMLVSIFNIRFLENKERIIGIGLRDGVYDGMRFYMDNKLRGRLLNDFDLSSFLIFGLYPDRKVFADQRPEAYPPEFFNEIFHSILFSEEYWEKYENKYNFQSIFLSNNSSYNVLNNFIRRREKDPEWNLVFKDEYVCILAKTRKN